ncbi:DUF397 domain-containing protein [Streptomyces sp. NPDC050997]|uniref:DUF397 domain-containing protein n=1 Tax=Streptomyces sp. NPDC050997 TaxID=3155519 RepID=UPI00343464A6
MNETPAAHQLTAGDWFKSSYSAADNECLEIAHAVTRVGIRDSKTLGRGGFTVGTDTFAVFIDGLKASSGIRIS